MQKRVAVEAFAAGELGCCTVPRAKPVVVSFLEPINTLMAKGAAAEILDSDDNNRNGGTSPGIKSGKATKKDDNITHDKTRQVSFDLGD